MKLKKSKPRTTLMIFLLLVIIAASVFGFYRVFKKPSLPPSSSPAGEPLPDFDPKVITIGVDSRPVCMLFYAVNHYIPRNRFQLRPVIVEDPNRRWMMLAAGELDMVFSTLPEFVLGSARHNPGVLVAFTSTSVGCDGIVTRHPHKSPGELTGRKVCAVPGSSGHYFLVRVLDRQGKSTAEVEFIFAADNETVLKYFNSSSDMEGAVLSGYSLFDAQRKNHLLIATDSFSPVSEVIVAGRPVIKNRPEDLQQVINSYYKLVDFIRGNPGLARKLISSRSGRSIPRVKEMLSAVRLNSLKEARAVEKEKLMDHMKKIQQIWSIEGLPNAEGWIEFDQVINYKFMEKALVKPEAPLFNTPSPEPSLPPKVSPPAPGLTPEPSPSPKVSPPVPGLTPEPSPLPKVSPPVPGLTPEPSPSPKVSPPVPGLTPEPSPLPKVSPSASPSGGPPPVVLP